VLVRDLSVLAYSLILVLLLGGFLVFGGLHLMTRLVRHIHLRHRI